MALERMQVDPFRWSVLWRDVPAAVWCITAVFGLLLTLATLVYPTYRGPDEPQHVDLAAALQRGEISPVWEPGAHPLSRGVDAGAVAPNVRTAEALRLSDREAVPRGARPTYEQALQGPPKTDKNQLVQHPPGYYLLLAGVLEVLPAWESWDFQRVATVLRMVNVLLVLPLPLIVHATARRATGDRAVALVATSAVLCIPQLVHIGGSVNNDNAGVLTSAAVLLLVVHVLSGDVSLRTAAWCGLVLGLALQSKGLSLVLVPVVTAAYLVAAVRRRSGLALGSLVLAGVVSGLVGGWWWVRNYLVYGMVQPSGTHPGGVRPAAPVALGWSDGGTQWVRSFVKLFTYRFFFDDPSGVSPFGAAFVLAMGAAVLTAALVLLALLARRTTLPGGLGRVDRLLLLAPLPLSVAVVARGSWDSFIRGLPLSAMQGRYAFGAVCGLAVLVALGLCRLLPARWHRRLPALVLLTAAGLQLLALFSALRLYWWSPDAGVSGTAQALLDWSPWPPAVPVLLSVATVAAVLALPFALRRSTAEPVEPGAGAPAPATDVPALERQANSARA